MLLQACTKSNKGGYYLIADVGQLDSLKEIGAHSKRGPAFLLPDSCIAGEDVRTT